MNNSLFFKVVVFLVLAFSFQKLVAQPQFITHDKVVFSSGSNGSSTGTSSSGPKVEGVIDDAVIFVAGSPNGIKLDTIHKKLVDLKKTTSEKANSFKWFNAHPTTSTHIEGFNIVITSTTSVPSKNLAELRFVRQKTTVWIDQKFNKPTVLSDIKHVVYSQQNRRADIETYGGYKFSLVIDGTTGKINLINALPNTVEVRVFKTAKLI
jgi:hypothetical protein